MNKRFRFLPLVGVLSLAAASAQAVVPESVTTAITTAGVDAATIGAAVLVVLVGIAAFKMMRKAM